MATTFLEPGGDADFGIGLWGASTGAPAAASDFVHGGHQRSDKYAINSVSHLSTAGGVLADNGSRISFYLYLNALPTATATIALAKSPGNIVFSLRLTSSGVLQLWNTATANQIGSNGSTLSTGIWYRISLAYTITSGTVNQIIEFLNGVSDIAVTNATLTNTGTSIFRVGNITGDATLDLRTSDHYCDSSSSLTDTGNIWVTAKRPFANGNTNGFSTQIGSGGSGYGSGHAPQVNERPLSNTNGWSIIGAGSAVTEEYTIEQLYQGDIIVPPDGIIDFMGWVDAKSATNETGKIIVANVQTNIALTSTESIFTQIAGSKSYPAGGTDIGIVTSATLTTVSLYECGIVVAFIKKQPFFLKMLTRR